MKTASYAQSFSRAAKEYDAYAYLQQTVARELASWIEGMECESILDLGCGTGALWRALRFKPRFFTGVDLSMEMLDLHPQDPAIRLIQSDFNHPSLYERSYDLIAASSSLQWSRDLAQSFDLIAKSAQNVAFAIFTSESLWEIHDYVDSHSPSPLKSESNRFLKSDSQESLSSSATLSLFPQESRCSPISKEVESLEADGLALPKARNSSKALLLSVSPLKCSFLLENP